jgi:hypothetical protein
MFNKKFHQKGVCRFVVMLNNKEDIELYEKWENSFEGRLAIEKDIINPKCDLCPDFMVVSYLTADYDRIIEEDRINAEKLRRAGK